MSQKNKSNDLEHGEVSINLFLERLYDSRKLIISITLIVTILASVFSILKDTSYESTALVEIGEYNFATKLYYDQNANLPQLDLLDSLFSLIESQKSLIDNLKIIFIHKNQEPSSISKLTILPLENKLIRITTISSNVDNSKDLINKMSLYIKKRHEDITSSNDKSISKRIQNEILLADEIIKYQLNKISNRLQSQLLSAQQNKDRLEATMNIITRQLNTSQITIDEKVKFIDSELEQQQNTFLIALKNTITENQLKINEIKDKLRNNTTENQLKINEIKDKLRNNAEKMNELDPIMLRDSSNLDLIESNPNFFQRLSGGAQIFNKVTYLQELNDQKILLENELLIVQNDFSFEKTLLENELLLANNELSFNQNQSSNSNSSLELLLEKLDTDNPSEEFSLYGLSMSQNEVKSAIIVLEKTISNIEKAIDGTDLSSRNISSDLGLIGPDQRLYMLKQDDAEFTKGLFQAQQTKKQLLNNLELLNSRAKTTSQLVGNISTTIKSIIMFNTIFGFIFGLTLSIVIVSIKSAFQNLRAFN